MEKKVTKKDTKLQIGRFIKARMLDKGLSIEDLARRYEQDMKTLRAPAACESVD